MKDILKTIAENKRREIRCLFPEENKTIENFTKNICSPVFSMRKSLQTNKPGIIAEFKRRSPSKGEIFPMADVNVIVPEYCKNGAAAISVLTDTRFFGGAISDLAMATSLSTIPVLRKDFIVSKIQIAEARKIGASAILLIASILSKEEMNEFNNFAHSLGLEALVEIHDIEELDKLDFVPDMLGVNNRNLATFHTDIANSLKIISSLPKDYWLVAESGIKSPVDILNLMQAGFKSFLIGEAFMATGNPGESLKKFVNEC